MKTWVKMIFVGFISLHSLNAVEQTNQTIGKNEDKPFDLRIFISAGGGAVIGYSRRNISIPKDTQFTDYFSSGQTSVLGGSELIFQNGHGLNVYGGVEGKALVVGANYVYESRGIYKWAVLTGFDGGMLVYDSKDSNTELRSGTLRYSVGVRLRKNRHAISLNVKIPLFASIEDHSISTTDWRIKVYPGVVPTIAYTYFFGL